MNKAVAALFVLLGTAVTAAARQSAMPADIVWKPIEIRNVDNFPKTADLYATLQEKEPYQGIKVERDRANRGHRRPRTLSGNRAS